MFSPGTGPASLQIDNESKTLTRQQLLPSTPSTDSASRPGNRYPRYPINTANKNLSKSTACLDPLIFFGAL